MRVIAKSELSPNGRIVATHEINDEAKTFIRIYSDLDLCQIILDTDSALQLKHLLDIALHGESPSWSKHGA